MAAGRPAQEIRALRARHDEIAHSLKEAQQAANPKAAAAAPANVQPWPKIRGQEEVDTVIVPRPKVPDTWRPERLTGAADAPVPPVVGPQASRQLSQLRPDAGAARADWAAVPGAAQADIRLNLLRTIEREAAAGNAAAGHLQKSLASGSIRIELEPGLNGSRAWTGSGGIALNPLDGPRLKTGEQLARDLLRNPPSNWETGLFPEP